MAFRSNIGRQMDFSLWSNRLITIGTLFVGAVGVLLVIRFDANSWLPVQAGGATFLIWAITRELDPDREASALIAAGLVGLWALSGFQVDLLPLVGLLLTARLIVETTGRRPLQTDLIAMVIVATAISFTALGWVGGFGLAAALYADNRMTAEHNNQAIVAALLAALGSSAVAFLFGVVPRSLLSAMPLLAIAAAGLALLAVLRAPPQPTSVVDARTNAFLKPDRLQVARVAVGLLLAIGVLIGQSDSPALTPVVIALAVSLASSELERLTRASR